jgi:hypothetical protein
MDEIQRIQRLGWEWRPDGIGSGTGPGVLLKVGVGGKMIQAFVPLSHVWISFDQELQSVGCASSASVGAPFSVGGFFSFVKKVASSVANRAKKLVPKAIQRAASRVVATAKKYGGAVVRGAQSIGKSPIFRGAMIAASFAVPALAPAAAALEIANRASQYYQQGLAAAKAIKAGANTAANAAAVARGLNARSALASVIQKAKAGDPRAKQLVGAFQRGLINQERHLPGGAQALQHAASAMRGLRLA